MFEHLTQKAIVEYKQSTLSPTELLAIDDHLADCADCRQKIKRNQNSAKLYQSFFEPLQQFAANDQENIQALLKVKWWSLGGFKSFHQTFFAVWAPQFALILIAVAIFSGFLVLWRKSSQLSTELTIENQQKEEIISNVFEETTSNRKDKNVIEPNQNVSPPPADKFAVKAVKSDKRQFLVSKTATRPGLNSSRIKDIVIKVGELAADESETLSTDSEVIKNSAISLTTKVNNRKKTFEINFSPVPGADKYEIYLAEMPKFITISRAEVKKTQWTLSFQKLKTKRSYVLQITALKENQAIQLTKKTIAIETVSKN